MINAVHNTTSSMMMFGPAGQVTSSFTSNTAGGALGPPQVHITVTTAMLGVLGSVVNLLLAVYLLICGIFTLRQSDKGATLHWIYVVIKIPAALLGAVTTGWVWWQFISSFNANNPPFDKLTIAMAILAALGCAYPVALLFVLRSRGVREYYGGVRA